MKKNEKEYVTGVELIEDNRDEKPISNQSGDEISINAVRTEYNHCFERSVKLDNKVYILLTACAFLFAMLMEAIKKLTQFCLPANKCEFISYGVYVALLTTVLISYVIVVIKLLNLLPGIKLSRFDSFEVLEKNMIWSDKRQSIKYICSRYEQCRDTNNKLIEQQYEKFKICVFILIVTIILLLITSVYGCLI